MYSYLVVCVRDLNKALALDTKLCCSNQNMMVACFFPCVWTMIKPDNLRGAGWDLLTI